jgi:ribosomal protein S18 acetylase RimI-like enzyme
VWRRFGLFAVAGSIADRLAAKVIGLCVSHVFCFEIGKTVFPPPPDSEAVYRFLTPSEIREYAADPVNELEASMADRVQVGHDLCFGVLVNRRLAGYGWCALGSIEREHTGGIDMSLPRHIGYMYKGFTHPDFRGLRFNANRIALAAAALAERGIRQLVCLVDWTNWASLHSCRRGGGQDLGLVATFQFAGRRFWLATDAARQIGLRFGSQ